MILRPLFVVLAAGVAAPSLAQTGMAQPGADGQPAGAPADASHPLDKLMPVIPARVSAIWENDSAFHTFFDSDDNNYTEGLRLDLSWQPEFARRWAAGLPLADQFKRIDAAVGVAVGQNLFTPDNLSSGAPVPDEHPYGSWLYSGFYLQRADDAKEDLLEVDIGVTGNWSGGEGTQKFIHRLIKSPDPHGWDNQVGSEVGANVQLNRTWKFGSGAQEGWRSEVLPYAGGVAGTIFTRASAGATFRAGYNIPPNFGGTRVGLVGDQVSPPGHGLGAYMFLRLGGRAVAHDKFLDGSLFASDDPSVGHEPLVGEVQAGVAVTVTRWLELGYSQTWWTKEFASEGHGQHFGAYTVSVHFDF